MRVELLAVAALIAVTSTEASAQVLNLSGPYRCVQECVEGLIGQPAFITQNGWDMRLVNEAGMPSRAWIDRPGHIWVDFWHEGAIYSVDGLTIQFDRGTVWQRDLAVLTPVAPVPSAVPVPSVVPVPPVSARPARNALAAPAPVERAPAGIMPSTAIGAWLFRRNLAAAARTIATAYRSATATLPRMLANPPA
jgi:hypothetical protein